MARPKSLELEVRNDLIRADAPRMSKTALAAKYGISITRVCQILAEEISAVDVEERAHLVAKYQGGMDRLWEIIDGPGRPITSGAGKHVIDENTGLPAYDPSPVVDAIRTMFQGNKQIAQLLGSEKPVAKPVEESPEFHEALNVMREAILRSNALEAENAALKARLTALEDGSVSIAEVVDQ